MVSGVAVLIATLSGIILCKRTKLQSAGDAGKAQSAQPNKSTSLREGL